MIKAAIVPQLKRFFFFVTVAFLVSCNEENAQLDVSLSSPALENDGKLSVHAVARFNAEIIGSTDSLDLVYEWSLSEGRGELMLDEESGNSNRTSSNFVMVRGVRAGSEIIGVRVIDQFSGNTLGKDQLAFEITEPSEVSGCYSEPTLFFRNNNWNNPVVTALGLDSDSEKTHRPSPQNWLFDISGDGKWFLRQDFSDSDNSEIWMDACDGSESRKLVEGRSIFSPTFGSNDQYVYYSEQISYPEQIQDPRARELVRVDIETGEKVFISEFRVFSSNPKVSPDGKWIAFVHSEQTFNASGSYAGSIRHVAVMPGEGGPATFLVEIDEGDVEELDWSPDSKDLIFHWNMPGGSTETRTDGIYRVLASGLGNAELVFAEPDADNSTVRYYAGGTRIAFHGHPGDGDTQYDIWSIDANGNDLKRLTDKDFNVFLSFVWEP